MPEMAETVVLHRIVDDLDRAVTALSHRVGDATAVRRLRGDVDRLRLDVADCDALHPVPPTAERIEVIPDTPYDEALWAGADDEGLGGHRGGAR